MKKNFNVIQIKGIRGLLLVAGFILCLAAGFIVFPGLIAMYIWNYAASFVAQLPTIGILQGILLWGIVAASYFLFRKEKLVVCMRSSEGLSEDELKSVFAEMKKQAKEDTFVKNLFKAQEAELKIKNLSESNIPKSDLAKDNIKEVHSK